MANSIQYDYKILDRYSGPLRTINKITEKFKKQASGAATVAGKMSASIGSMKQKASSAATLIANRFRPIIEKLNATVKKGSDKFRDYQNKIGGISGKMKELGGNMSLMVTAPIVAVGVMALRSASMLETMKTSFVSLLGSTDAATKMMKKLTDFTAKTPFQLEGVGKSAKQLLSFGVSTDMLFERMKMLGDISAGASIPLSDMAGIFGKIKAKGKAMTEELLQMSDRGIPIIDILAKQMKKPKAAIFDLASKGKISFKVITESLKKMTSKGGIYFDQMGKQSETMAGIFSTVTDNVSLLLGDIGTTIADVFGIKDIGKSLISGMQKLRSWILKVKETNPFLVKAAFILIALASAAGPVIVGIGILATAFSAITWPIIAAVAAIGLVVSAFTYWIKTSNPLIDTLKSIGSIVWDTVSSFLEIFGIADSGSSIISLMASAFDSLGIVISFMLKPLEALLIGLNTVVKVAADLISMDFGKALETMKGGFSKFATVFGFSDESSKAAAGASASAAQTRATEQNVNVGGTIRVSADPGTKVTNLTPDLNVGPNMMWAAH